MFKAEGNDGGFIAVVPAKNDANQTLKPPTFNETAKNVDSYMKFYQKQCKPMDDNFDDHVKRCDVKTLGEKVFNLVVARKWSKIKPLLREGGKRLLSRESGCKEAWLAKLTKRSHNAQSCYCSMFGGVLLNPKYYTMPALDGIHRYSSANLGVRLAYAPRAWMDSNKGGMAHWHTSSASSPLKMVLTRYEFPEDKRVSGTDVGHRLVMERKVLRERGGVPVCRMWVTFDYRACQTSPQFKNQGVAPLKCECKRGLFGRQVLTGQMKVTATNKTHADQIEHAECKKWFVVNDGLTRAIFSGFQILAYLANKPNCFSQTRTV
jgi:hypothetical protein